MSELEIVDSENKKVGSVELTGDVFGVKVREHLVQRYVVMQQASARRGTASTIENRGDIRGGGKKPWRQKGTGRARQGSIRAAQWRGGMTVFGPTPRDYSFPLTKKSKKIAIKSVLTERAKDNAITVVQDLNLSEPKTKQAVALIKKLDLPEKTLFVIADSKEDGKEEGSNNLKLAVRNLPKADVLPVGGVNVVDLLKHERIVFTPESLKQIEERLN